MEHTFWYHKDETERGTVFCWENGVYMIKMHSPEISPEGEEIHEPDDIRFFSYHLEIFVRKEEDWQCLADTETIYMSGLTELPEILSKLQRMDVQECGQRVVVYDSLIETDTEYQYMMHTLWENEDHFSVCKAGAPNYETNRPIPWYHMTISSGVISVRLTALCEDEIRQFQQMVNDFIQYAIALWNQEDHED